MFVADPKRDLRSRGAGGQLDDIGPAAPRPRKAQVI
jgi:hypothetical protein